MIINNQIIEKNNNEIFSQQRFLIIKKKIKILD